MDLKEHSVPEQAHNHVLEYVKNITSFEIIQLQTVVHSINLMFLNDWGKIKLRQVIL